MGTFFNEAQTIVADRSQELLVSHKRETRKPRIVRQVGAAACAAVAVLTGWIGTQINAPDATTIRYFAQAHGLAVTASATATEFNGILDSPLSAQQRQEITAAIALLLERESQEAQQLSERATNARERKLGKLLGQLSEQGNDIDSGNIPAGQKAQLYRTADELIVDSSMPKPDLAGGYVIVGGMILAYGAFGIGLVQAASKKGGRLDPRMQAYKNGTVTGSDVTNSEAVNSFFDLGQKVRYTPVSLARITKRPT